MLEESQEGWLPLESRQVDPQHGLWVWRRLPQVPLPLKTGRAEETVWEEPREGRQEPGWVGGQDPELEEVPGANQVRVLEEAKDCHPHQTLVPDSARSHGQTKWPRCQG